MQLTMYSLLLLFIFVLTTVTSIKSDALTLKLDEIYISNLELTKCDNTSSYPVSVENVTIEMGNNKHVHMSGILITTEDLISPVKASVTLKKKVFFGWIPIPCEKNVGSCDYNDLCSYGYPENKECPPEFIKNGIPCRCPIKQGTYTLPPISHQLSADMDDRLILKGKYKGNVLVRHENEILSCYNMKFVLQEK